MALAQTHDVLTSESWQGADVGELVAQALRPHGERFRGTGPCVSLPPRLAISLALALHELATNAAKYGSLSNASGAVDITWAIAPAPEHSTAACVDARSKTTGAQRNLEAAPAPAAQRLVLRWIEKGGPPVKPPTRQGFGTKLLQRALPTEAGVSVTVEFNPDGLVCVIEATLPPAAKAADALS
jgi:two-component sensor histidine kinase